MPWPIYSERILHHGSAGTWNYVVPSETRLVLKELVVCQANAAPTSIVVRIGSIALLILINPAVNSTESHALNAVAYQGETVQLQIGATGSHCTLSGYLFADLSGRTGPPLESATKPNPPTRPEVEPQLRIA